MITWGQFGIEFTGVFHRSELADIIEPFIKAGNDASGMIHLRKQLGITLKDAKEIYNTIKETITTDPDFKRIS